MSGLCDGSTGDGDVPANNAGIQRDRILVNMIAAGCDVVHSRGALGEPRARFRLARTDGTVIPGREAAASDPLGEA